MTKAPFWYLAVPALLVAGTALAQYPIMDMVADDVIQRYRDASCEQLWQDRGKPKSERAQQAIQMLRDDAQMRQAFIDRIAAPVANKLFECGLVP